MNGRSLLLVALVGPLVLGCPSGKKKAEERAAARQAEIEQARADRKAAQDQPAKEAAAAPAVRLEPFWDDAAYLKVSPDGACPEGLWALFPGPAPGDDAAARKANEAKRAELARSLKDATVLLKLRVGDSLKLLDYNAAKGELPIELKGVIDCKDSAGNVSIGLGDAKAITPGSSAAKQGAEVAMRIWDAPALRYVHPLRSMADAKEFLTKHRFDLEARVVFKLGRAEVDKKMVRIAKATSGEISIGGGNEDWGAGRMVRAQLLGVRIAADHGRLALVEQRSK